MGKVIQGQKLGRTLGFPTANLLPDPSCRLRHGIYAVRVVVRTNTYDGVASYGRRPTFDNGPALLEAYLFDFSGDLYGETIEVLFTGWIRLNPQRFRCAGSTGRGAKCASFAWRANRQRDAVILLSQRNS